MLPYTLSTRSPLSVACCPASSCVARSPSGVAEEDLHAARACREYAAGEVEMPRAAFSKLNMVSQNETRATHHDISIRERRDFVRWRRVSARWREVEDRVGVREEGAREGAVDAVRRGEVCAAAPTDVEICCRPARIRATRCAIQAENQM